MKDWAEWIFLAILIFGVWVWDDPRRAGHALSEFATEFQRGVAEGQQ